MTQYQIRVLPQASRLGVVLAPFWDHPLDLRKINIGSMAKKEAPPVVLSSGSMKILVPRVTPGHQRVEDCREKINTVGPAKFDKMYAIFRPGDNRNLPKGN